LLIKRINIGYVAENQTTYCVFCKLVAGDDSSKASLFLDSLPGKIGSIRGNQEELGDVISRTEIININKL